MASSIIPEICPYCSRPMRFGTQEAGRRICSLCGDPIRKNHKWGIGSDGRLRHKSCSNPTGKSDKIVEKGLF